MSTPRAKFQSDAPETDADTPEPKQKNFYSRSARPRGHSGKTGMKRHKRSRRRY